MLPLYSTKTVIMETVDYGNPAYEEEHHKSCRSCGEPCEGDWCSDYCHKVWADY